MKKILLFISFTISLSAYSKVLATIGNEPITTEDVNRFKTHLIYSGFPEEVTSDQAFVLDYIINAKLAVLELKSTGLDQTEEAKDSIDGALYNYYLRKNVDSKLKDKKFSKQEITNFYKKYPVVKIQRIALQFNPNSDPNKKEVYSKLSLIRSDILNKKTSFDAVIEKYSKNDPTTLTGTFDKIPSAMLSSEEKESIKETPVMSISSILAGNDYFCIIRIIKIYPIGAGDYLPINEILVQQSTAEEKASLVKALREKYSSIINIK